jgi:general secretion pathway protein N
MRFLAPAFTILVLLAALATFAPASLLQARLAATTQGRLQLVDASGTVWNGRGMLSGEAHEWAMPVEWHIAAYPLLRGDVAIGLQAADGADLPRGTITWRDRALTLDGVALDLPAASLQTLVPGGTPIAFGGRLALDAPHFSWNGESGDGALSLQWNGARIAIDAGTATLGTVNIRLAPRDGRLQGQIDNRDGDVRIQGALSFGGTGASIDATVTPLPSTPTTVSRVLGALGTPDAAGAVRLQWRGGSR